MIIEPIDLQAELDRMRSGQRTVLTFDELVQVDIQIGSQQAEIASLKKLIREILHERAAAAYIARLP